LRGYFIIFTHKKCKNKKKTKKKLPPDLPDDSFN